MSIFPNFTMGCYGIFKAKKLISLKILKQSTRSADPDLTSAFYCLVFQPLQISNHYLEYTYVQTVLKWQGACKGVKVALILVPHLKPLAPHLLFLFS